MTALLIENIALLAGADDGVAKLRSLVLDLAIRGQLVPQVVTDEPASALLSRIAQLKAGRALKSKVKPVEPATPLRQLPRGWVWTTLADAALVNPRNQADDDADASFVPMAAIGTGFGDGHTQEIRRWGEIKTGFTHFAEGDVGVAKITPCFENSKACVFTGLVNGLGAGTTELHIVRPIGETLSPRYVLAYLKAPWFLATGETKMTGTAGQKRLPKDFVEHHPFPLPPLAEQHRIVAKVDELMALCDRLEARQQDAEAAHERLVQVLLDGLTQARDAKEFQVFWLQLAEQFQALFTTESSINSLKQAVLQAGCSGLLTARVNTTHPAHSLNTVASSERPFNIPPSWQWVKLGDLCTMVTSGSRGWKEFYADQGSTFIRSQDIKTDRLEFDQRAYVSLPANVEGARTQVRQHDLLITITGANVGKAAELLDVLEDAYVSQHVALVRLREPTQAVYIHQWLINGYGGRQLLLASSYGAKPGLNLQNIKDLPVPLPPAEEQLMVVAKVDELLSLCDQLKARIAAARQHHALLAKAMVAQV